MSDWNPEQYRRFEDERRQPFLDLLALLPPTLGGRWLDLGCGDGRNTELAARRLGARHVLGVDTSPAMIQDARALDTAGGATSFEWREGDLRGTIESHDRFDLVLSNAALQWVPDHEAWFATLLDRVTPGGWLAVQMPYNHVSRSHLLMEAVGGMDPFQQALGGWTRAWPQRSPDFYADALEAAGFDFRIVQLRTYRHAFTGWQPIVEMVRSTGLRPWLDRLEGGTREAFIQRYGQLIDLAYPTCDAQDTRLFDFTRLFVVGRRPPTRDDA